MPFSNCDDLKKYQQTWHAANKDGRSRKVKQYRLQVRAEVNRLKESRGCADCKHKFPYYVLQFDHLDGAAKVGEIRDLIRSASRERVMAEIEKCHVVCANCHAVRTFQRSVTE